MHFRLKYQKGIDISVENAYNLFVDMEHKFQKRGMPNEIK